MYEVRTGGRVITSLISLHCGSAVEPTALTRHVRTLQNSLTCAFVFLLWLRSQR